ncbi:hypothetical protein CUJ84_pRLN3000508 (plasmid) [Rhizobium leguminosarum]|uniref:Sigma-54 factor interaction domain-containing protein n=1 Tax=Rhizobium leguminosarum TaxID=384 RepID=A0A2K9ZHB9_RHILE|nr:hypothetical protein CUJ84_pRLN3000508 [Rhizobium leguminosarum]
MPALKDRVEDIPAIAARILTQINKSFNRQVAGFHPRTLDLMTAYGWPGNVRELYSPWRNSLRSSMESRSQIRAKRGMWEWNTGYR